MTYLGTLLNVILNLLLHDDVEESWSSWHFGKVLRNSRVGGITSYLWTNNLKVLYYEKISFTTLHGFDDHRVVSEVRRFENLGQIK